MRKKKPLMNLDMSIKQICKKERKSKNNKKNFRNQDKDICQYNASFMKKSCF